MRDFIRTTNLLLASFELDYKVIDAVLGQRLPRPDVVQLRFDEVHSIDVGMSVEYRFHQLKRLPTRYFWNYL